MGKRIIALLALILFILLIVNLNFIHYETTTMTIIYVLIVIGFAVFMFIKRNDNTVSKEDFMNFKVGYGKENKEFVIPTKNYMGKLVPNEVVIERTGVDAVKYALENPINSERLSSLIKPGQKIVIVTSDITRPMPSKVVLPYVIDEILEAGAKLDDITIVFGLGSHRKHTEDEKKYIVSEEIYNKVKCIDSNPDDVKHLGTTKRGTPVDIFSVVADADFRICLGNIEYHYFAGYSGGAKAIMPGVSTREAIQCNHSAMVKDEAKAGDMINNPVRQDIDEVGEFISIDFILNVVLDESKEIIYASAGHYIDAHRKGCEFLDQFYKISIPFKADIVIVSPGGYPKDINLYQAQKALDNAKHAVKDGGVIILVAACTEGLGEKVFEKWMLNAESNDSMIEDIQKHFELGGHKAAAIALVNKKASIYLVSDMKPDFVEKIFMKPFDSVDEALQNALKVVGKDSNVLFMPFGGSTLPYVDND